MSTEPKDQAGAMKQGQQDAQKGTRTDTQNWGYVQRENYEKGRQTNK